MDSQLYYISELVFLVNFEMFLRFLRLVLGSWEINDNQVIDFFSANQANNKEQGHESLWSLIKPSQDYNNLTRSKSKTFCSRIQYTSGKWGLIGVLSLSAKLLGCKKRGEKPIKGQVVYGVSVFSTYCILVTFKFKKQCTISEQSRYTMMLFERCQLTHFLI